MNRTIGMYTRIPVHRVDELALSCTCGQRGTPCGTHSARDAHRDLASHGGGEIAMHRLGKRPRTKSPKMRVELIPLERVV